MFPLGKYKIHEPKGLVNKHHDLIYLARPYNHECWEDDLFLENARDWDEVMVRWKNTHLTIFKTLSLDEQMEEITRGVDEVERVNKDLKEARLLEEISKRGG